MDMKSYLEEYAHDNPVQPETLVRYHGSITSKHGLYIVSEDAQGVPGSYTLINANDPHNPNAMVWNVRRGSFTVVEDE